MSALDTQIGGNHYKSMAIQPAQYIVANGIGFLEGMVIKYVSRWEKKGGIEDLEKAIHCLQLRVEMAKQGKGMAPVGKLEKYPNRGDEVIPVGDVKVATLADLNTWAGLGK